VSIREQGVFFFFFSIRGGCPVGLGGEERADKPTGVPTNNVAKRPYCIYPRARLRAKGGVHAPYLANFPLFLLFVHELDAKFYLYPNNYEQLEKCKDQGKETPFSSTPSSYSPSLSGIRVIGSHLSLKTVT
jgi:hypothetical protein